MQPCSERKQCDLLQLEKKKRAKRALNGFVIVILFIWNEKSQGGKIEIEEKTRQNAENKQTDL